MNDRYIKVTKWFMEHYILEIIVVLTFVVMAITYFTK